ncbi:hypothetical protein TNCV_2093791, partial [Trichonephila clavipes]
RSADGSDIRCSNGSKICLSEIERVSTWNDRTKNPKQYRVQERMKLHSSSRNAPVKGLRSLGSEESGDKDVNSELLRFVPST